MSNTLLRTGLVFNPHFRETSGTSIADWKSGIAGTLTGGTLNQTGPGLNKAIQFNGTTDFIEWTNAALGTLLDMGGSNPAAIGVWFKTSTDLNQILCQKSTDGLTARTQLYYDETTDQIQAAINDGVDAAGPQGGTNVDDGAWHRALMVIDRSANLARLYIDGTSVATASLTNVGAPDNAGSLFFGKRAYAPGPLYFTGFQALPAVWINRLMSAADATEEYNGGHGLPLRTPVATSITPSSATQGDAVTVTSVVGDHFAGNSQTTFILRHATYGDILSATFTPSSLTGGAGTITIPSGATPGSYSLVIKVNGEESSATAAAFTVISSTPPTVTSCSPAAGIIGTALQITVGGTGYEATISAVKLTRTGFTDITCTGILRDSDTSLRATVPSTAGPLGEWYVKVTNSSSGLSGTSSTPLFTIAPTTNTSDPRHPVAGANAILKPPDAVDVVI